MNLNLIKHNTDPINWLQLWAVRCLREHSSFQIPGSSAPRWPLLSVLQTE